MATQKMIRYMIADYMNTGTSVSPTWTLMGTGFESLDENPSAKIDTTAYIDDRSASGTIIGYETTFPFNTQYIVGEGAIDKITDVFENQKTGSDAEVEYLRVKILDSEDDATRTARKFTTAIEVSSVSGAGTEIVRISGSLHQVGDLVPGKFNVTTSTFTENA